MGLCQEASESAIISDPRQDRFSDLRMSCMVIYCVA
jgi:hypothetical protein